jgi:hypothetical protein
MKNIYTKKRNIRNINRVNCRKIKIIFLLTVLALIQLTFFSSFSVAEEPIINQNQEISNAKTYHSPPVCSQWPKYRDNQMASDFDMTFKKTIVYGDGVRDVLRGIEQLKADTSTFYGIDATSDNALIVGYVSSFVNKYVHIFQKAASILQMEQKTPIGLISSTGNTFECWLPNTIEDLRENKTVSFSNLTKCAAGEAVKETFSKAGEVAADTILILTSIGEDTHTIALLNENQEGLKNTVQERLSNMGLQLDKYQNELEYYSNHLKYLNNVKNEIDGICLQREEFDKTRERKKNLKQNLTPKNKYLSNAHTKTEDSKKKRLNLDEITAKCARLGDAAVECVDRELSNARSKGLIVD